MKLIKDVLANVLANMIIIILTSLGSAAMLVFGSVKVVILKTNGLNVHPFYWILLIVALSISVFCVVFDIVYIIRKAKRPVFPEIQSEIRYEKAETELFFKDRENIFCTREVRGEVICDKVTHITKRFTWTGSSYKNTILEKAMGRYTIIDNKRNRPPQSFEIRFDSEKRNGDRISFKAKTELEDAEHVMWPCLAHHVKGQTDLLTLRVTTPVGLIKNAIFMEYADTAAEIPLSKPEPIEAKNIGNLVSYEKIIKRPQLLHNYRIEWEFDDNTEI